jgi:glycerophosphoryl diester phosphodiesterase
MKNWIKELPIAHRGLHNENNSVYENSLSAFKEAIEHGYAIELDLLLSKDKEVMVFHDLDLERMTGHKKNIEDCDLSELKKLKLKDSSDQIPTLAEVLNFVQGQVPLLIEIKSEEFKGEIEVETCKLLQNYNGEFAIQSFNPWTVKWFKDNAPEMKRGLLAGSLSDVKLNPVKKLILRGLLFSPIVKADFIALEYGAYNPNLAKKIAALYKVKDVIYWTITDPKNAHHLRADAGLNYIFEKFQPLS